MTKKKLYHLLASVSLLGAVSSQTVFQSSVVYANDFSAQKGTFTVGGSVINVRTAPSTDAEIAASYQPGQQVNYDQIGTANGYRWISYVGSSGSRRYMAIGTADGSQTFGSLSADNGGSSTSTSSGGLESGNFSSLAGRWVNGRGEELTIDANGWTTNSTMSDQLSYSRVLDGVHTLSVGKSPVGYHLIPAGVTSETYNIYKLSDSSRDRIVIFASAATSSSRPDLPAEEFYYRAEEAPAEEEPKEESKPVEEEKEDFSFLEGKWVNQLGEEVSITKDGIVTQYGYDYVEYEESDGTLVHFDKAVKGQTVEGDNLIFGGYQSGRRGNNYYIYAPAGSLLVDKLRPNEDLGIDKENDRLILVRAEHGPQSTPIEEFLFTRVKEEPSENDTESSADKENKQETKQSDDKADKTEKSEIATDGASLSWESFKKGDYSELVGTWKNGKGQVYTIDASGRMDEVIEGEPADTYRQLTYQESGAYVAPLYTREEQKQVEEKEEFQLAILESGKPADWLKPDASDSSQVRLLIYQTAKDVPAEEFFYRVGEEKEETTASSSKTDKGNAVSSSSSSSSTKTETSQSSNSSQTETSQTDTSSSTTTTTQPTTEVKQEVKANPIQRVYKTLTNRQDLPSTGESVSVLGGVGLLLVGLAAFIHRRRK